MRISLVLQVIVLLHYVELHLGRLAFPFLASSVIPTSNGARFSQQTSDDLDPELEKYYLPKDGFVPSAGQSSSERTSRRRGSRDLVSRGDDSGEDNRPSWLQRLPKVHLRCDPLINLKMKQKLKVLGACVTVGLDYMTDIAQWRSFCSIEDSWLNGRFSMRGSELGWAKSWPLNLGLGEEFTAKLKLRLGLNLKTQRLYAKLRFRTVPMSPFDIGDGLCCEGRLPVPVYMLPSLTRHLPLRIEYRVHINTSKGPVGGHYGRRSNSASVSSGNSRGRSSSSKSSWSKPTRSPPATTAAQPSGIYNAASSNNENNSGSNMRKPSSYKVVTMSTGLGAIDVSLDELNFCLEWDEKSPVWGIGLVRSEPSRKKLLSAPVGGGKSNGKSSSSSTSSSASTSSSRGMSGNAVPGSGFRRSMNAQ